MPWLLLAAAAVAAASAYLVSLRLHPWWPCRSCGGSGKTRDWLWGKATGACPKCGGRGRLPRLGIRVLQRERAREMLPEKGAHRKADRRAR